MTATDAQVRLAMKERQKGRTQEQAAAKANLQSRKTLSKYERLGRLPSELKAPRIYRTRPDPFEADWPELEAMLQAAPELDAKVLFEWLCERQPGQYDEGQLRTLQRRVSIWRALHRQALLTLEQVHRPGEVLQTDGTWMNTLGITLGGQVFPHLLIHCVLPYSNWAWGRVAQSESLLSIRLGLQSALARLGHVPAIHQTDNTTAATHHLGPQMQGQSLAERGYNPDYLLLLAHFGMQPRTIHVASPNENGDIEAANGAFKRAVEQHLLLRGHRDFADLAEYEAFLGCILDKRNVLRQARLAEELAVMKPLAVALLPEMQEFRPRVSSGGTIRVLNNVYSVPSGLKGCLVTARVYEWHIEVWYANQQVDTFPRLTGLGHHHVNYRHVIDTLLRKPGGFRDYRYRDDLFPSGIFRQTWEVLNGRLPPHRADVAYLRILKLAADGSETDVAGVLVQLLATPTLWDDGTVAARLARTLPAPPALQPGVVNLAEYDRLLGMEVGHVIA
jgi:transcriptional regulator with XRE-family HTH domain